jgi:lysine 2,3-aminomutase
VEPTGTQRMRFDTNSSEWTDWRWHLKNRISTPEQLSRLIPLSDDEADAVRRVTDRFPMTITPYYASLIDPDDPNCPIRRQVVPIADELHDPVGVTDPIEETTQSPVPGVIRIYPDRVAFTVFDVCPVFCRFCFRKRLFDPSSEPPPSDYIDAGIKWISEHEEIRDVLITGGDPLMATDMWLERLLSRIRAIPHVEIIRFGTRMPVALPQRITPELCEILERFHPLWINTHFNHPRELTPEAAKACDMLTRAGIPVGNQSVLLRGVNDDEATMQRLTRGLLKMRVRPYYLFQCHLVAGTSHFRTPIERGVEIAQSLRGHTSGLGNPLFIVDTPHGKVPILPKRGLLKRDGDDVLLETYTGDVWRELNPIDHRPEDAPE